MEQAKDENRSNGKTAKGERRFVLFLYAAIVPIGLVVVYFMFVKPPSAGVFCSTSSGCYEADFGSGFGDGSIAFFLPGGARSKRLPLVRESRGVYGASFLGDARVRLVVEDDDHFVRDGETTYGRSAPDDVQRHLDAALRDARREREREDAVRGAEEAEQTAKVRAKERQTKIDSLVSMLAGAKDETERTALEKRLAEERAKQAAEGGSAPASTTGKPCKCEPGDPLCSCL
ncbi:hypothetical protein [Polyangium spumosum]|uniref:Uncharacterized protein n=1 Tax=Polyangium spumosum TaxID=889282 RepID=A0A6N7PM12_9BACT|nr:hypothetical protein [Polyangium spumosum]MRG92817.1 hypothetical protein [Polyangium spumosum]